MFGRCREPVWRKDDFTHCFQRDYLQVLFPLLTCALSFAFIATKLAWAFHARYTNSKKCEPVLLAVDHEYNSVEEDRDSVADLTLQKTTSHTHQPVLDVHKPTGETTLVSVELTALLGEVAIGVLGLVLRHGQKRKDSLLIPISTIAVWSYIAFLASIRLFFSATKWHLRILRLWNHTAILYGTQWLWHVFVFRSAVIYPQDRLSRNLAIASFSLTSLLATLALVSRKGNRKVILEYEDDIEPSKEALASVLSLLSFAWVDGIIWKGYKRTLEIQDVWNLLPNDKAEYVIVQFRQVKKAHTLAIKLLLFFKMQVLIQGIWCMIGSIFMFLPSLLVKAILEHLEDPEKVPVNAAWLYTIFLFFTGLGQAIGDGQSLWIGRRTCIQLRALIIGEIYSKVLRRKATASVEAETTEEEPEKAVTFMQRLKAWKRRSSKQNQQLNPLTSKGPEAQANNGTVINLMSVDSFKVAEISSYLHFLWAATPVQLIMAITLLYKILGSSAFVGIFMMFLCLPLNITIATRFQAAQKRILAATDARIHATNEVLQNIRIIKYFAWEQRFMDNVNEKRKKELAAVWKKYILWSGAFTVWSAVPLLITLATFLVFTMIEKRSLVPSIAFPALSMFSLLRIPLDQLADMLAHVQESKVSIDRVEQFLNEEETEKYNLLQKSKQASPHETRIALQNATLSWGSDVATSGTDTPSDFRLIDMNTEFMIGKLNVIVGATGSGKTSLLMALLGEMKLSEGHVFIPGGHSRADLLPDAETGLTESVAYCAQQAWLINANIRENILFALPYDAYRYKQVIAATALERDLEILDAGDQTLVGEKGISLSGGQKQRISLARALYSNSRHLLLDDCLSAVDSHTGKHIYEQAVRGPLMEHRTCILVSHNVALTVPQADMVVVLDNGKIIAQGLPNTVIQSGILGDEILKSRPTSIQQSALPSRRGSVDDHDAQIDQTTLESGKPTKQFVDTRIETKAEGHIKLATIKMYLGYMGPWYYWLFAASGFISVQLGSLATNLWIRRWANAYTKPTTQQVLHYGLHQNPTFRTHILSGGPMIQFPISLAGNASMLSDSDSNDVDAGYYLGVYALIALAYITICFLREITLFWGSVGAAWEIHELLLGNIMKATFRFFDSTPLGQLTNRFSRDILAIDQEVAPVAIGMFHSLAAVFTVIVLIAFITPAFLIPGFFIACMYIATGLLYIRSSRDLKRLESVERSPLFQHFGETLSGVVTIRAYGDEARFVQESNTKVNTYNRPFLYLWATNRWLGFRIDLAGAFVSFFSAMFVLLSVGRIDAGTAGLSLTYAVQFSQNVFWLVRLYAVNEQNMNSVERVQEYIDVEQEAAAQVPENKPASNWPSQGNIEFANYSTRYRKDLDPVLRHLTFRIQAAEKIGIVGRTGAGKSSLTLALFRSLEAEEGKILIDGVNIGLIGLQDLRQAITIVPQDPTLFTGTLRNNLDPFNLFTDEEVFTALRRVQLISSSYDKKSSDAGSSTSSRREASEASGEQSGNGTASTGSTLARYFTNTKDSNQNIFLNLSSPIAESGSNISQGQRQLLCLARALLKSPKVLVMDEATASIDYATDSKIQDTLRELKDNTIITIAHRLQTIIDYDKVLVLDKGEVVEYADPYELIRKENGMFRGMCETSGDMELLQTLAKKAWESRRLIDDE